ncbi:hypothetical protein I7I51_00635 [Histoplasma capsulatum]|uniref:Uncharacterized protein n=1 Tax=Ajellomyces capsulatus TaxID=5037 RepID=A0A8A1MHI2_AJECA|nr:hypothetical protein I7I51_00635 [Histoplasma capsulatum]
MLAKSHKHNWPISPSRSPSVLPVGKFGAIINILHLVPEDGTIERFVITIRSSTFSAPQAREQIGRWRGPLPVVLNDIETPARKLWNDSPSSSPTQSVDMIQRVKAILQPTALDTIREREGPAASMNATRMCPVYVVVRIARPRAGRILTEPTSFPH